MTWHLSFPIPDFFFAAVHIGHNWCAYFTTEEAEELKAVFSNVTSVSEELDFQKNSGQVESSQVQ